ncbi:MAG TPA: type II toxin-antitoxin system death-on-curing family toxin [Niallia sp.]|nr:type II toxin-antitoxin system death-on-curing family toxin [Niallia sp.]HWK23164.1 type II toxin-antitoxin system death-on-curing family toxin [Ureibacillus sp.]
MKTLNIEQILHFHTKIIAATGGSDGTSDRGMIESAIGKAFVTFDGQDLYPDVYKKIAVTTYALIKNHGFVDGNKRIGIASMILLLKLNEIRIEYTQKELVDLGIGIAEGKLTEVDIELWIKRHQV